MTEFIVNPVQAADLLKRFKSDEEEKKRLRKIVEEVAQRRFDIIEGRIIHHIGERLSDALTKSTEGRLPSPVRAALVNNVRFPRISITFPNKSTKFQNQHDRLKWEPPSWEGMSEDARREYSDIVRAFDAKKDKRDWPLEHVQFFRQILNKIVAAFKQAGFLIYVMSDDQVAAIESEPVINLIPKEENDIVIPEHNFFLYVAIEDRA